MEKKGGDNMFQVEEIVEEVTEVQQEVTKRPLGELLLEGAYIIQQDLDFALEHQQYSNEQLGEILVRMGAVTREDIDTLLGVQGNFFTFE